MTEHATDPWLVVSIAVAFLAGLLSLFAFIWLRTLARETSLKSRSADKSGTERLESYEKQLIDLRIGMDALEMAGAGRREDGNGMQEVPPAALARGLAQILSQLPGTEEEAAGSGSAGQEERVETGVVAGEGDADGSVPKAAFSAYTNPVDYVLHLITSGITTSRDIQITMEKSREHTSRLLKKMYEDGYLERNEGSRPYTYAVTPKGAERLQHVTGSG